MRKAEAKLADAAEATFNSVTEGVAPSEVIYVNGPQRVYLDSVEETE